MEKTYEGMFLLDNQVVREDWKSAKRVVTDALEKHGAKVLTARRWDERKLAYPVRGKRRGTYLLVWYAAEVSGIPAMRREFDLSEKVLRYLMLASDGVPEVERALAEAENAADFTIPAPPPDDAVEEEPIPRRAESDELLEAVPEEAAIDAVPEAAREED